MYYYHVRIRMCEKLGSGQFGVVNKGVWSVGDEEREVAIKSLADFSTEEKRIQFLQEAAIMGQFKHPNVITLHGILTTGNSVRDGRFIMKVFIFILEYSSTDDDCCRNDAQRRPT